MKNLFLNILKTIASFSVLVFSVAALADKLSLYEQPKADAKIIASIDTSAGIIPIFSPKESSWVKIADPKNGNVGWVKSHDLDNSSFKSTLTITTHTDRHDKSPYTYQIAALGQAAPLTAEQMQAIANKMQTQQRTLQKTMHDMVYKIDKLFFEDWPIAFDHSFPLVIPFVVFPETKPVSATDKSPADSH